MNLVGWYARIEDYRFAMGLAGTPTTVRSSATSRVTTAPAPGLATHGHITQRNSVGTNFALPQPEIDTFVESAHQTSYADVDLERKAPEVRMSLLRSMKYSVRFQVTGDRLIRHLLIVSYSDDHFRWYENRREGGVEQEPEATCARSNWGSLLTISVSAP